MLVRECYNEAEYFYFDPEHSGRFISLKILWFLQYYFLKSVSLNAGIISSLKTAYLASLVRAVSPKVVVTAIDNNPHFFNAARIFDPKIKFVAIQNGMHLYNNSFFYPNFHKIFIPEFICFGSYDKDTLTASSAHIGRFHSVGSVYGHKAQTLSSADSLGCDSNSTLKYDVCLVSEDYSGWDAEFPGLESAWGTIAEFCFRYCKENKLTLAIALKGTIGSKKRTSEISFLSRFMDLGDDHVVLSENQNWWSSYDITSTSVVSVGMASTLLFENAFRGNKVLICDVFGDEWTFGEHYPLIFKNRKQSYSAFKCEIERIMKISRRQFFEERKPLISYFISDSEETLEDVLRKIQNY